MQWLALSLVLSVALTVVLNVVVRVFPRASERAATHLANAARPRVGKGPGGRSTVRVLVPWKAMLLASLLLTIALNLALWIRS